MRESTASSRRPPTPVDGPVDLPDRGTTSVRHLPGPPGAPDVLLLHGLGATGRLNWRTSQDELTERFGVTILDHRGHGGGIRTRRFRLADCADDAVALADVLGIDRFVAVGYSMGGPIAKLAWHRHRDRVAGLVLCATARHFIRPEARGVASAILPGVVTLARLSPETFQRRLIDRSVARIEEPDRRERVRREMSGSDPASVMQAARALVRFSSHEWSSDIDVPTAVVVTTEDQLVPPSRQYKLAAAVPGSEVYEVAGDHVACVDAPEVFVPTLVQACEDVARRAGPATPEAW